MPKAIVFGLIASGALFLGALVSVFLKDLPQKHQRTVERVNKAIMAFGAGVLLCTLAFDLMEDAYAKGGYDETTIGFVVGALVFLALDLWLDHYGSGVEILLGALLDGIPESAVIGIGLVAGKGLGFTMMVAVFISNFPEGMSGTRDMLKPGGEITKVYKPKEVLLLWGGVTAVCTLSTVAGYAFLGSASPSFIAFMLAAAAGAILAMVAHTMIPEAFSGLKELMKEGRKGTGSTRFMLSDKVEAMAVVAGWLLSFILTRITR